MDKMDKCTRCGKPTDIIVKLEAYHHGKKIGETNKLCSVCHFEHCMNTVTKALGTGAAKMTIIDKEDL